MFLAFLNTLIASAYFQDHEEKAFVQWMRNNNQVYTGDEYQIRFGIFLTNNKLVKEHNSINGGYSISLNKFAAMTPSEYKALLGYKQNLYQRKAYSSTRISNNLESIDWRKKGVVNDIKDQGNCGSCWAFSTIQAAESANAISSGKLESYSEQNLVDCVTSCMGCSGGLMNYAYDYILSHQGGKFNLESDYPYMQTEGTCKFEQYQKVGSVSHYINVESGNEDQLASLITQYGPACVAIDASHWSFQLYTSGIYDEPACSSEFLDHGVGCVGFGQEGNTKYWIVRNSWGLSWGESGYIRMIWKNNQCGIASNACIPIV